MRTLRSQQPTIRIAIALALVATVAATCCPADVTTVGDVDPADPAVWNDTYLAVIGDTGIGLVYVTDGSDLSSSTTYIGHGAGSTGVITLQGAGTTWNNAYSQYVGYSGSGSLVVTNGAAVSSWNGVVGYGVGSRGLAMVSGFGSSWNLVTDLSIGHSPYFGDEGGSSGELIIASGATVNAAKSTTVWSRSGSSGKIHFDGGTLNTGFLTAARTDLTGVGTVNTGGLASDVDLYFDASRGLNQTFELNDSLGQRITINLSVDETQPIYAGYSGSGSITIADGFELASGTGYIGYGAGSSGRATVRGVGSAWKLLGSLYVGGPYEDSVAGPRDGALSITEGAFVTSPSAFVGYNSNSSGQVSVKGAGSAWELSTTAYVGFNGAGDVLISDGGSASSASTYIGYRPGSSGRASIEGIGSEWNTGSLYVGYEGAGSLAISSGASVNVSGPATVAYGTGSTGSIEFDGGVLNTGDLTAAAAELTGVGTINASGLVKSDINLVFDATSGLSQTVTLDDSPGQNITLNLTVNQADPIYTGYRGAGTMTIADGFDFSSAGGYLGYTAGSSGRVTVRGPGSSWSSTDNLNVGHAGNGSLQISDGATVSVVGTTTVAKEDGSTGAIHFDGGALNTGMLIAAGADLTGEGTINTSGLVSDADLIFDASHGLKQSVLLNDLPGQNITINLAFHESNALYAGYRGAGSVTIADGFKLSTRGGVIGDGPSSSGQVTVEGAGSGWNSSGEVYVGNKGDGSLTIADGADVVSFSGSIGVYPESSGLVTVQGAGSTWQVQGSSSYWLGSVTVGSSGSGSLVVSDGAVVTSQYGYVGHFPGSTGRAEVRGAGSAWKISQTLDIGRYGDGELIISDGGLVSSRLGEIGTAGRVVVVGTDSRWELSDDLLLNSERSRTLTLGDGASVNVLGETVVAVDPGAAGVIYFEGGTLNTGSLSAAPATLAGAGVINTNGLVSDINLVFDATHGLSQTLAIDQLPGQDISLHLTVDGLHPIGVGYAGAGSISIAEGFQLASSHGYLGYETGSSGQAAVRGAGSAWEISSELEVGRRGEGSLAITAGGSVSSSSAYIGYEADSSGRVSVMGDGTEFTSDYSMYVGLEGRGELAISDGAAVTSNGAYVGYNQGASGQVTVRGPGSEWNGVGSHYIGFSGEGSLTVADGASVSDYRGVIGYGTGSSGHVHLVGTGSTWNLSDRLNVGLQGSGVLSVSDGATVNVGGATVVGREGGLSGSIHFDGGTLNTGSLESALAGLIGLGTVNTGALMSDVDLLFDATHGLSQTLLLNELPNQNITVNLSLEGSAPMYAGYAGAGSLTVADGFELTSAKGYLGYRQGSSGRAAIDGVGSAWTSYSLYVGYGGDGALDISDGATVFSRYGSIGDAVWSSGRVTVEGTGSTWTNEYSLVVGDEGRGELAISDGAAVTSNGAYLGYQRWSSGQARVQGAGSTWTMLGDLYVGYDGDGELNITEGGAVSSRSGYLGKNQGSSSHVAVDGVGSRWNLSGNLRVDYGGARSLIVSNGAAVIVSGSTTVTHNTDSPGAIHFSGGTLNTSDLTAAGVDLTGVGTINTGGLISDVNLVFDATHGLTQTVKLDDLPGQDITINLTVDEGDPIYAGYMGAGSITISDGFNLESRSYGHIGSKVGSSGQVTVRGEGSVWDIWNYLSVGYDGDGTLTISDGATASAGYSVYIGHRKGSSGTVNVQGADAKLNTGFVRVGYYGDGVLKIADGGEVNSSGAVIGQEVDSSGRVTVDGTGSAWHVSNVITVGSASTGELTISNGATVSSDDGYIGSYRSSGRVAVRGVGSRWDIADDLEIGTSQDRALTISDGAVVGVVGSTVAAVGGEIHFEGGTLTTGSLRAAATDLTGVGTINTGSLISDVDLVFDGTHGLAQTIRLDDQPGQDITVNLTVAEYEPLYVGYQGSGSMIIADGFVLGSRRGYVGVESRSSGVVTVQGAGSTWNIWEDLSVGSSGAGVLTVIDGAAVSSRSGYIGASSSRVIVQGAGSEWRLQESLSVAGSLTISEGGRVLSSHGSITGNYESAGQVDVSGDGSAWNLSNSLYLGSNAYGSSSTLSISEGASVNVPGSTTVASGEIHFDGGTLTTGFLTATNAGLTGTGTINTRGLTKVDIDLVFDATHGTTQTLKLDKLPGQDITINLSLEETGPTYVGYVDSGSLTIADGFALTSTQGYIGFQRGSSGSATVRGAGSSWKVSEFLIVGYDGVGSLAITEGASVSSKSASIGSFTATTGSQATVDGVGSEWNIAQNLSVGVRNYSVLTIAGGAAVNVGGSTVVSDRYANSASEIHFDGGTLTTGSLTAASTELTGQGTINTGSLVSDVDLVFNATRGLNQTVILDRLPGQNVTINLTVDKTKALVTGYRSSGSTTIAEGFRLSTQGGMIGDQSGASGQVTVQGAGSAWDNSSYLYVGNDGDGSLTITDGGSVKNTAAYIGGSDGSSGRVTVHGTGSVWDVTSTLSVANYGDGDLTIIGDGAVKAAGRLSINGRPQHISGSIRMATGGSLALRGDAGASLKKFLELIDGTDDINYWDEDLGEWSALIDASYGLDYTLEYSRWGLLAGYTVLQVGVAPNLPGDFNDDGRVDAADYTVWRDNAGSKGVSLPNDTYRGEIGESQLALWRANYGKSLDGLNSAVATNLSTVPEPAGVSLAVLGISLLWPTRARRWTAP